MQEFLFFFKVIFLHGRYVDLLFFITQSINRDAASVGISHLPTPIQ